MYSEVLSPTTWVDWIASLRLTFCAIKCSLVTKLPQVYMRCLKSKP